MTYTEERRHYPTYICRCEEIDDVKVRQAIAEGARSINDVKRRTRAGMGVCQGIFCVQPIVDLLSRHTNTPVEAIEPMTARPPVRPISLETLANLDVTDT